MNRVGRHCSTARNSAAGEMRILDIGSRAGSVELQGEHVLAVVDALEAVHEGTSAQCSKTGEARNIG